MTDRLRSLTNSLKSLDTERRNDRSRDIDILNASAIVALIQQEDAEISAVVAGALAEIARTAELAADAIRGGGRVIYAGAGTSGRLGVLDAAECPPTFGTDPSQVIGLIAGGDPALRLSREGVEDNTVAASRDFTALHPTPRDFVIGIAASRRTPYPIQILKDAKQLGCRTAFLICNEARELAIAPDVVIALPVGPEIITGSTRMKSGTATKMALNMISTTAMALLGKTYGNLMVDLKATSEKLAARSRKILMDLLGINFDDADTLLARASGSVKTAIVMGKRQVEKAEAERLLSEAGGFVRRALGEWPT